MSKILKNETKYLERTLKYLIENDDNSEKVKNEIARNERLLEKL